MNELDEIQSIREHAKRLALENVLLKQTVTELKIVIAGLSRSYVQTPEYRFEHPPKDEAPLSDAYGILDRSQR